MMSLGCLEDHSKKKICTVYGGFVNIKILGSFER